MELNVYRFTDFGFSLQFRTESWHSSVWFYRCQKLPTNGRTEEVSNGKMFLLKPLETFASLFGYQEPIYSRRKTQCKA